MTQFDLFCDRQIWVPAFDSYMLGLALGSLGFGLMSDKLGRKKTLIAATIVATGFSLAASLAPSYEMYAVFRMLVGVGAEGWWAGSIISCFLSFSLVRLLFLPKGELLFSSGEQVKLIHVH